MDLETIAGRLRWARRHHGKYSTPTEAARAFGWTVSTYLGHENGDRNPSIATAKRYAQRYGVRWQWILDRDGEALIAQSRASIIGEISAGAAIDFYPQGTVYDYAELPPGGTSRTVAVQVVGGSMRGIADERWLIYFDNEKRPPGKELLGKLCVVELDDGSVLLRVLQPGRRKDRFDLESTTEPTMRDRKVTWAARITWLKPR